MGRSIRFVVEGDVYMAFSPNRYTSSWEKRRRVTAWRERTWGAWYRTRTPPLTPPVKVTITVYRGREVDADNLQAALKHVIDGLTAKKRGPMQFACLPDDSRQTIHELQVEGVFSPEWVGKEWLEVEVEEVKDAEP